MLVLSRRVDESIVINGEIVVTVLEVGRNGQVRLGIQAPRHYQIYRHELLVEIQRENHDALSSAAVSEASVTGTGSGERPVVQPGATPPDP